MSFKGRSPKVGAGMRCMDFGKSLYEEEFEVFKSSEVRIQGLYGDGQKKFIALVQQLADVST